MVERRHVDPFDVDPLRVLGHRMARLHRPRRPSVVLGSSQPLTLVDRGRADAAGVEIQRRRSGGGAVWIDAGDPLWVDLWVPSDDPLSMADVIEAGRWVGERWAQVLVSLGAPDVAVHAGRSTPGRPAPVCFGDLGPGEVTVGGRKAVGLAQWRSRQGALFHCAVYRRWDPVPLVEVLDIDAAARRALADHLAGFAIGLEAVLGGEAIARLDSPWLWQRLLPRPESWEYRTTR
jgi:lipoate-protein ligase A